MKLLKFTVFFLGILFVTGLAFAQIQVPLPTATPEFHRQHFSYNHIKPVNVMEKEDILITVYVEDVLTRDEMRVHFKKKAESGFHALAMGYNPADSRFEVEIEDEFHGNKSIEYYIEIFPQGLPPIRIPEERGEYYTVKVHRRLTRFLKPVLFAFMICAPFIGVYIFSKVRKAHARKRAEYERKIRSRRRRLNKEREKHYKEYLKSLKGGQRRGSTTRPPGSGPQSRLPDKSVDKSTKPQPQQTPTKPKKTPVKKNEDNLSTDEELRKELDAILNKTADTETVMLDKETPEKKSPRKPHPKQKPSKKNDHPKQLSDDEKQKLEDLFSE